MLPRWVLLSLAAVAWAQPKFEIQGRVVEPGVGGIADAEVAVSTFDEANRMVRSDAQGNFRVAVEHAGMYFVNAIKKGYFNYQVPRLMLTAAQPSGELRVELVQGGQVGGRVLDEETREPVAGVEVFLLHKTWNFGQVELVNAVQQSVKADEDGRFLFSANVRPGDYVVSAWGASSGAQATAKFTKAEAEANDSTWDARYWPGGGDAASSQPVHVSSRGYGDVGVMYVRKSEQYRAVATVGEGCTEDDQIKLTLLKRSGGKGTSLGRFECGSQVLLRGLDPGSYALYAVSSHQGGRDDLEAALTGVGLFEIADNNVAVLVPLQPISVIEGQLVLGEGVSKTQVTPRISTRPVDVMPGAEALDETFLVWGDNGHFRLGVTPYAQRLGVSPFAGQHYVKEVRFGGAPLSDMVLPAGAGGPQKLEIVLSDQKRGAMGVVMDGARPAADAVVLVIPEGRSSRELAAAPPFNIVTNAQGNFSADAAPGEYRIVAVTRDGREKLNQPGVMDHALATAQRVTIPAGSTQSFEVRLLDPR